MKPLVIITILVAMCAANAEDTKPDIATIPESEIPSAVVEIVLSEPKQTRKTVLDKMLAWVAKKHQAVLPDVVWFVTKSDLHLVPSVITKVQEMREAGTLVSYASFAQGGLPVPPKPPELGTLGYTMRGDPVVVPIEEAAGVIGLDPRRVRSRR